MNQYRFWTDRMIEATRLEQAARLRNLQKMAERGYDVAISFEQVETDLLELKQEQDRRKALQPE